jgi:hypothetical protein
MVPLGFCWRHGELDNIALIRGPNPAGPHETARTDSIATCPTEGGCPARLWSRNKRQRVDIRQHSLTARGSQRDPTARRVASAA